MASIFQLHVPTPISSCCTVAKTLNPTSFLCALSHRKSISVSRRSLSISVLRFSAGEFPGTVADDERAEESDQVDYSDDDDIDDVDAIALEQEAKNAVLEYSSSLSRILSIGESLFHLGSQFVVFFSPHLCSLR